MTGPPQAALATLSHDRFWEQGWVYERKLDGQRVLAVRDGSGARLYSRSGRDVTAAFPEIAEALAEQAAPAFVVDGEVVAFEGSRTSFARLQPRIHVADAARARRTGVAVWFYAFDVLEVEGRDLRPEPLLARKRELRRLLKWRRPLRFTPHRVRADEEWFTEICRRGWEGLIAKRADVAYPTGRTDSWLKFKCEAGQELVVVGWTDPAGSRVLREGAAGPAREALGPRGGVLAVHPRHAAHRRRPLGAAPAGGRGRLHRVDLGRPAAAPALPRPAHGQVSRRRGEGGPMSEDPRNNEAEVAGIGISKPDKVLFPAAGSEPAVTKLDLARYYESVADAMLPHLRQRPISMQRFPDGLEGPSFYEKKVPSHFPDLIRTVEVATADGTQCQVVVSDTRTLVYLAQQACVTPHTWLSRADRLDRPDQLVFDLDPSVPGLAEVRRATRLVGELLDDIGLTSVVKTSGSRGYHVLVPLRRRYDFDDARGFARNVAAVLVDREPDLLTLEARKDKRGDRVLVDVQRNGYGQTVVPPYAVRARPGAPVSVPLTWEELAEVEPDGFTLRTVGHRLARGGDRWADLPAGQSLGRARERLSRRA